MFQLASLEARSSVGDVCPLMAMPADCLRGASIRWPALSGNAWQSRNAPKFFRNSCVFSRQTLHATIQHMLPIPLAPLPHNIFSLPQQTIPTPSPLHIHMSLNDPLRHPRTEPSARKRRKQRRRITQTLQQPRRRTRSPPSVPSLPSLPPRGKESMQATRLHASTQKCPAARPRNRLQTLRRCHAQSRPTRRYAPTHHRRTL